MSEGRKKATSALAAEAGGTSKSKGGSKDPATARLLKTGAAVGNDELQKRISQGNASRDELMKFLVQRLHVVREAQLRELSLTRHHSQREWTNVVSDTQLDKLTKPEPTRWREVGRAYEEAALALCRGSLDRGRQLLEEAVEADQKAFEELTELVHTDDLETEAEAPEIGDEIGTNQACGACEPPGDLDLAKQIQNVTTEVETPPVQERTMDPWWTEDEEEGEEKPDGAGA